MLNNIPHFGMSSMHPKPRLYRDLVDLYKGRCESTGETLTLLYINNQCADQNVHRRSLISSFVFRFLESVRALPTIRGCRKFCQRRSNFDSVLYGIHRPANETPFKWRFAGVLTMAQHWMLAW